jgi:hypothetical protein
MFYCVEMKINSKIVELFEKHEVKKIAYSLTPFVVDDVRTKDGGLFWHALVLPLLYNLIPRVILK